MIIPINISQSDFIDYYINLLNPFLKLKPKELEVYISICKVYYHNKDLKDINTLLFKRSTLKAIRQSLNMSTNSFNNFKFKLRSKGLITDTFLSDTTLNLLPLNPTSTEITFKFTITKNN